MAYHGTFNAFFMDLPVASFVFHSSLLTVKGVRFGGTRDGFFCVTEIIYSGFFDDIGPFRKILDLYYYVTLADNEYYGYFTFQTIVDGTGVCGTIIIFRVATLCFSNSF